MSRTFQTVDYDVTLDSTVRLRDGPPADRLDPTLTLDGLRMNTGGYMLPHLQGEAAHQIDTLLAGEY